ncbi:MAG: FG-GAP-like repeat-containing protein [Cyanobacteria bacterium P01_F01_bin.143]
MQQIINKNIATVEKTILVVIDPRVKTPENLAAGVRNNAAVLLLNTNKDSISQITITLSQGNYQTLHLVSHGSPGCLHLGNTNLTSENLAQYNQQLLEWGIAEILVYGCNVAAAPEFLTQLHSLTGASIAASAQEVGQGNWNLEWQIGEITADSAFVEELKQEYQGSFIGFQPQVTFAAGNDPLGVAIGDLDGDGNSDIVVNNQDDDTISVLLGDGSGGFSAQTTFAVGGEPFFLAIGDLDGDGNLDDLAVTNSEDDNVSILLGDDSGGFAAQTTFTTGNFPRSVAIGDLDGDGNLDDLVTTNQLSASISVLFGDNSGGFSAPTNLSTPTFPRSVAIGDLDDDGNVDDLAVANRGANNVSVFLGDNSGGFSTPTTFAAGNVPQSIAIGDLDGDGNADDFVVVNTDDDNVSVFLGDNSGGFSAQTTFTVGNAPRFVAIGDLDGDGSADDLVVVNSSDNNVSVLLGNGSGSFSAQTTFAVGDLPYTVAVADLDGDGNADDLVVNNRNDGNVSVLIECFLTGTNILTEQGEVAVEQLQIGDTVITAEGRTETIKWISKQTIKPYQVKNPLRGYPVLIKAGALGKNLPHRDLYVSPDHAMFVDGLLINAGALVNDISIVKTEPTETFTYYHVELENHCLLIAEGTAAESYLPQKENRDEYDNFAEYEELYPEGSNLMLWPMDYPRISSWNKVPRFVSKKLLKIADQLFGQDIKLRA